MAGARATVPSNWWAAPKGKCYERSIPYVRSVDMFQRPLFEKFVRLTSTYDVNPRTNRHTAASVRRSNGKSIMTENLIATNIDTVAAAVATTDIEARIQTDGADWSHQRTAKRLELYINGLAKLFCVGDKCRIGFKYGGELKGTGVNKVWIDQFDQIRVTSVPIDNIVVDELECRDGHPRQMHYRDFFDRDEMRAQFPQFATQIDKAQATGQSGGWTMWAGYRPIQTNQVVVIESWRLPIGPPGHANYVPGRHVLCIDGCDLLDDEYGDPFYPFSWMHWNRPDWGFYGIGLAERILPFQNLMNRRSYQINKSLDRKVDPITYVKQTDQNLAVKSLNQIGAIAVYRDTLPVTIDHAAVGKETYNSQDSIRALAAAEGRVNQNMQTGGVPAGIESGVGVREVRQTNTQPFSVQEKAFKQFWLDTLWLVLHMCKQLGGTKAPAILKVSKYGNERIKWSEVDMDDLRIELTAASTLSDSPAGRQQRVVELSQAGVITLDESRKLMDHPDIERILSLYNAMLEDIEATIEDILDGKQDITPEPFQNLSVGCSLMQKQYLIAKRNGAPEEVLEALTDWISIAANILNPPAPPQQMGMPAPAPGMGGPGMLPPGGPPPLGLPAGPAAQTSASAGAYAPGTFAPMTA